MDGDPPAAMRYTEAKMTRVSESLLADIDKETVDFRDTYDSTRQEPIVLPAKLPNLLLNGQVGIAVGMATNIPTHNLGEVVDATVTLIDNPEATLDDLMKCIKGPDFPTGAVVYGGAPMRQAYATGRGSVTIRAVANIEETKRGRHQIIVSEMPYGVNKATLIEKIADLVHEKKITAISALRDESARGNVRVVIELKKDSYPKKVLNQLYKLTVLQTNFHYNMLALVPSADDATRLQPRVLGLHDILNEFIKHRRQVVRRRTEYELRKAKERAHILEGYKIALDNIDEVIRIIRASKTQDEAEKALIEKFSLSVIQAKAILAMQLRRLTGLEREAIENELTELMKKIAYFEKVLADENEILRIIKEELLEIKDKYGRPDYVDSSAAGYTRWNWDSGLSILHRRYKFLTATATKPGLVTFDDVSVGDPAYRLTDVYGTADKVFTDSQYDSYYYYNEKGVGYLSFSVSKLTGDIVEIHMDRTSV